ncbi:hypothetical protein PHLH6_32100 [Pseudomonas sp. Seg1]|uniref:hypothetical protein n=1 Tax=unclassified Pseudomonas TaxID=196821 RepID=UPI001BB3EEF0|nr:hypothetical protein [Pseudomonas sp. Seg1]BBP71206.1 hypothetical protein PHLH6_32100 [Pseudomonas sp. Seg1]
MNIDPYKRQILYRKAQGKKVLSQYQMKMASLVGLSFDESLLLSLPETDSIIAVLMAAREISCVRKEYSLSVEALSFAFSAIENQKYYLLVDEDWKYCGAYVVESGVLLCTGFDFDKTRSDEIRLISDDFSTQVSIDYSETCGEKIFECCIKKYEQP